MKNLSIVVPLFNEAETLPLLIKRMDELLPRMKNELKSINAAQDSVDVEILFVNDGSTDGTCALLESLVKEKPEYRYISLSRNFGHQAAVSAGIHFACGNAVAIMDGDLQDPPELIIDMLKKFKQGFEVIYAVRRKREASLFMNIGYKLFYMIKCCISDFPVQKDAGDFSLLHRKVIDAIKTLPEKERYIRGLRAWVGFRQTELPYDRISRKDGKSKYSIWALGKLAFQGILATSIKPLLLSGIFTICSLVLIIVIALYVLLSKFFVNINVMPKGWSSLMITIVILNGFQLISTWILSLYIARIHLETLSRPTYLVAHDSLLDK